MKFLPHLLLITLISTGYAHCEIEFIPPRLRTAKPFEMMLASSVAVVGKVSKIEGDLVEVTPYEGAPKSEPKLPYKIANVKISETLLGAKGLNSIRVGFPANAGTGDSSKIEIKGRGEIPYGYGFALTEGQEGIFILRRHFEGDFYEFASTPTTTPTLFETKAVNHDIVLDLVKLYSLALKDPVTALKAKSEDDRIKTVSFLAQRYRETHSKTQIEETIPAEETKLILKALLELPWPLSQTDPQPYRSLELNFNKWVIRENGALKFAYPTYKPGLPYEEVQKLYKDAVTKFVNDNMDKIILKKYIEKK